MIVPHRKNLVEGWVGVGRPSLSNGTAHALPMTDDEKHAIADRPKQPFGFQAPPPVKRRRRRAR